MARPAPSCLTRGGACERARLAGHQVDQELAQLRKQAGSQQRLGLQGNDVGGGRWAEVVRG
mgnify:CR=1 FL=1